MARTDPAISSHIKDIWPDDRLPDLIQAARQVRHLMGHPGWEAIQLVLDAEIASIDSTLEHGRAKEAADYAKALGRRSALNASKDAASAILEKAKARAEVAIQQQQAAEPVLQEA